MMASENSTGRIYHVYRRISEKFVTTVRNAKRVLGIGVLERSEINGSAVFVLAVSESMQLLWRV